MRDKDIKALYLCVFDLVDKKGADVTNNCLNDILDIFSLAENSSHLTDLLFQEIQKEGE